MEPWAVELLQVWNDSTDDISRELLTAFERDPSQKGRWDMDSMRMLIRGGHAVFQAEMNGHGNEMRETYLQSVLPGIYEQGGTLEGLGAVTIMLAMRIYPMLTQRISEPHREQAGDFLCMAYGKYMSDTIRVGMEVLNAKA